MTPHRLELPPGRIAFRVVSRLPAFEGFCVKDDRPLANWVSAAYVTALQDFRDLFAGEFLSPDTAFGIRSLTLMFTDLEASTAMYEREGDSRAFGLVQEHFRAMSEVLRRFQGGIVKTIGDAVMAAFPSNLLGLRAACEIQQVFRRERARLGGLGVKIGLHRGPVIAVTSNRSLDYFGRTVNLAARVQGASLAREVLASPAALEGEEVRAWLAGAGLTARTRHVPLKGIADAFEVHSFFP